MGQILDLLTLNETATELRCCPRTVRRMVKRGELRAVRIGKGQRKRTFVPRSELEAWQARQLLESAIAPADEETEADRILRGVG